MTEPELTVRYSAEDRAGQLRADVRAGLTGTPKSLPPKWFYDAEGSELFEKITRLPEYYQTRAEHEILRENASGIASWTGAETLVELGSGSSEKTRLLLDATRAAGTLKSFVAVDVSESALRSAIRSISSEYPSLRVHGIVDDFLAGGALPGDSQRMVVFLGGTIGNLLPEQRAGFLRSLRADLFAGEWLLLGTDLVKEPARLVRAYADAEGITAEFDRNVLRVLNRELGATFDPDLFTHVARWNSAREWIEMRLRAQRSMRVEIADLDMSVDLGAGEEIRTEVSAKFRAERIRAELDAAGFDLLHWWTDSAGEFAVSLARAETTRSLR